MIEVQNNMLEQNLEDLAEIYDPNAPEETWFVQYCGGEYQIRKDVTRPRTAPKWYVDRMNDLRLSKRFYSRPAGAFLALQCGAIEWRD